MIIQNKDLIGLGNFLADLTLKGSASRLRTRFIKKLQEQLNKVDEEKQEILKNYGELDEKGNIKTKEENGSKVYVISDREACEKEMLELFDEVMVIEENQENEKMLKIIRDAVLNCEREFTGQMAFDFDRYCELFENLTYDKELAH
jgi:hypothetical protein